MDICSYSSWVHVTYAHIAIGAVFLALGLVWWVVNATRGYDPYYRVSSKYAVVACIFMMIAGVLEFLYAQKRYTYTHFKIGTGLDYISVGFTFLTIFNVLRRIVDWEETFYPWFNLVVFLPIFSTGLSFATPFVYPVNYNAAQGLFIAAFAMVIITYLFILYLIFGLVKRNNTSDSPYHRSNYRLLLLVSASVSMVAYAAFMLGKAGMGRAGAACVVPGATVVLVYVTRAIAFICCDLINFSLATDNMGYRSQKSDFAVPL